jgi:colanic acid/amylovoran biosynthesis glycosyltransferase
MPTIAYLANLFPSRTERYVADEIQELRYRGITVVPCSIRQPAALDNDLSSFHVETLYLLPLRLTTLPPAVWLCLRQFLRLKQFVYRILLRGKESPGKRVRALTHTFLGVYYAAVLKDSSVGHIHVHHGYFGSWVAMVAARLLEIEFSMTLHGSDLLLHPAYLDLKLELCQTCFTISEFNRRHILDHYPEVDPQKIVVQRLGVECGRGATPRLQKKHDPFLLVMLTAGRLHPVKDHAFLIRACGLMKTRGFNFTCLIAGEGPERRSLERLIRKLGLQNQVQLLGQVSHEQMHDYYQRVDLVVLTSRSEGIPLVLMEAMAHGKPVLAPAITSIPELICDRENGFLYRPASLEDFVTRVGMISNNRSTLGLLRRAARRHVLDHFNRKKNLSAFCDRLVANLALAAAPLPNPGVSDPRITYENPVLQ